MFKKIAKKMIGHNVHQRVGEQSSQYYDEMYASSEEYCKPYWQSRYYFIWTVLVDRLRLASPTKILEIGCGSGQFAELLHRDLQLEYVGIDISSTAIAQARSKSLGNFRFEVADALESPLLDGEYDSIVCTEVLEHLEEDLELLGRIALGTRCLCTVPNFPYESHVRHFASEHEVHDRYGQFFEDMSVWGIAGSHQEGVVYYLIDGKKKPFE